MSNIFEQYDCLVDNYNREKENAHDNEKFYMLCLSLIPNREEIEQKATELADKHGLLGALRLQQQKNKGGVCQKK